MDLNRSWFLFMKRYLLFSFIFATLMIPIYIGAFKLLEGNEEKNIDWEIAKGMDILDNEISSLNHVIQEFQTDKYFTYIRYLDAPQKTSDYYALLELRENFSDLTGSFVFTTNPVVYFPNGIIMCRSTVYSTQSQSNMAHFYPVDFGNLDSWFEVIATKQHQYEFLPVEMFYSMEEGVFEGLPYVCSYGMSKQETYPMFAATIHLDTLLELWGLKELQEEANIIIYNSKTGDVLYTNGIQVDGSNCFFQSTSNKAALGIKVLIPKSYFREKLAGLELIALVYLLFFLISVIVGCAILAYRNANQHEKLNQELASWMLREQILNGLDEKRLKELLQIHCDFPMPFQLLIVQLVHTDCEYTFLEVQGELSKCGIQIDFFSRVKPNLYVMLSSCGWSNEIWKEYLNRFVMSVHQKCRYGCVVFVSKACYSLEHLNDIYITGRWNMKYYSEKCLIFQELVEKEEGDGLVELNLMENIRLTDLILDGRQEEATKLISEQWDKVRKSYVHMMLEQLFFMQAAVLNSIAIRLDCENRLDLLVYNENIAEIEQKILSFTSELCRAAVKNRLDKKDDLPQRVMEYINFHYCDESLYMTTLADIFHVSDKTIARAIKRYSNQTFSEYLEQLRMQKAVALLENPRLGMEYIANACGFSSVNTFFKVFKRRFGVSPSGYRRNINMGKEQDLQE